MEIGFSARQENGKSLLGCTRHEDVSHYCAERLTSANRPCLLVARSDAPISKRNDKLGLSNTRKDWLVKLHWCADRARYEVCHHVADPHTPFFALVRLKNIARNSCAFHFVTAERRTTWVIRASHTVFDGLLAGRGPQPGRQGCHF